MSDYTGGEDGYVPLTGASRTPYDITNTTRHEVLNFEGTPTQFYDDTGLKAILTRDGIMDVNSFNPLAKEGEKITAQTARQATDADNQLLFLDANGEQTTRPTGTPMVGGMVGDAAYMKKPVHGGGVFGAIGHDFREMAKDPEFHKFLIAAAAIASGGLALNAAVGVGGLAAAGTGAAGTGLAPVATAFPVSSGALAQGAPLAASGAGGIGAGGLGVAGGDIGAFTAADAAASAAGGAGGAGAGGAGLTGAEVLKYANMAKSGLGLVSGIAGAGGAGGTPAAGGNYGSYGTGGGGALPGSLASTSLPGSSVTMLDPFKDYNKFEQIRAVQDDQDMRSIPISEPLYAASGGDVTSLAQIQERLSQLDPRLNSVLQNKLKANYYTYGSDSSGGLPTQLMGSQLGAKPNPGYPAQAASNAKASLYDTYGFKPASLNQQEKAPETVYAKDGGHIPEFITGATGHYVKGRGDGQSDSIPAMLADGEYVFDAETVAQLGNGSSDAGAKILDRMRQNIREHKRSAPVDKIPPKSKSPLEYMAESKRK